MKSVFWGFQILISLILVVLVLTGKTLTWNSAFAVVYAVIEVAIWIGYLMVERKKDVSKFLWTVLFGSIIFGAAVCLLDVASAKSTANIQETLVSGALAGLSGGLFAVAPESLIFAWKLSKKKGTKSKKPAKPVDLPPVGPTPSQNAN